MFNYCLRIVVLVHDKGHYNYCEKHCSAHFITISCINTGGTGYGLGIVGCMHTISCLALCVFVSFSLTELPDNYCNQFFLE